jgi:hypothetical protein
MMKRRSSGGSKGKQIPQKQAKKWEPKKAPKYNAADDEEIDSDEAFNEEDYKKYGDLFDKKKKTAQVINCCLDHK